MNVRVDKLVVSPEETEDLAQPVSIEVGYSPSAPIANAVWVLKLEVDMSSDADTERHVLPLAAVCDGAVSGACSSQLTSAPWPAGSLQQAQAAESTGALLRLSLFDLPAATLGASVLSESKGADSATLDDLPQVLAAVAGKESLLDISFMVDIEGGEGGSPQVRNIYNPLE